MNWPFVAVHLSMLRTGKIVLWDGWELTSFAKVWDPSTNQFSDVTNQSGLFCASQDMLADGSLLVIGGHAGGEVGIKDTNIYNPGTDSWTHVADMHYARWYPSEQHAARRPRRCDQRPDHVGRLRRHAGGLRSRSRTRGQRCRA